MVRSHHPVQQLCCVDRHSSTICNPHLSTVVAGGENSAGSPFGFSNCTTQLWSASELASRARASVSPPWGWKPGALDRNALTQFNVSQRCGVS